MVQIPNRRKAFWSFEIEIWDLFGICDLVFGISTLFGSGYAGLGLRKNAFRSLPTSLSRGRRRVSALWTKGDEGGFDGFSKALNGYPLRSLGLCVEIGYYSKSIWNGIG